VIHQAATARIWATSVWPCRIFSMPSRFKASVPFPKLRRRYDQTIVSSVEIKSYNAFLDQLPKMEESDE